MPNLTDGWTGQREQHNSLANIQEKVEEGYTTLFGREPDIDLLAQDYIRIDRWIIGKATRWDDLGVEYGFHLGKLIPDILKPGLNKFCISQGGFFKWDHEVVKALLCEVFDDELSCFIEDWADSECKEVVA